MGIADFAAEMVATVRARGEVPAYMAVSTDVYSRWQQENSGVEPVVIRGLSIRIRDNFKPKTILIFGEKVEEPVANGMTLDAVMSKIERGDYGPDAEASTLLHLTSRAEGLSGHDGGKAMQEYLDSLERAKAQLASDALQAVRLESHPLATDIVRFAKKMVGHDWDDMKILIILKRIGEFVHCSTLE